MSEVPPLDLPDIQGLVTTGYAHMPHSRFLFLAVADRTGAKAWLKNLVPEISTSGRRASKEKPQTAVNIAFTARGLAQFGMTPEDVSTFPREYQQGMDCGDRSRVLGDTGDSAPSQWEVGGPTTGELHVLLLLYAISEHGLQTLSDRLWESISTGSGLTEVFRQDSFKHSINEPFGFRDGISQPAIEGGHGVVTPGQSVLKAGEFILGYVNEYSVLPPMPSVDAKLPGSDLLPLSAVNGSRREFGRNGTFLVWRKLSQDVEAFWEFMDSQTRGTDGTSDKDKQIALASKMVGRWPSGAPLTLAPLHDDPQLGANAERNNDFKFIANCDAEGFACPVDSHIRRTNPRDTLPPDPKKSNVVSERHRLLRRGRPYIQTIPDGKKEEGILFMALNSDLQRQFEFVQQTWMNSPKFNGLFNNKDPLVSDNDGTGCMIIQDKPVRICIQGMPRFVQVKGGGYFFLPGIIALQFLTHE